MNILYSLFPLEGNHLLSDNSGHWGSVLLPVRFCSGSRGGNMLHLAVENKTRG